jgi:hypothetical protein
MTIARPVTPLSFWRDDLKDRYIFLFGADATRYIRAPQLSTLRDGWREVAERLCLQLALIMSASSGARLIIERIRSKNGVMDVSWSGSGLDKETAAQVNEAIALAMARSACTCEECGEVVRLLVSFPALKWSYSGSKPNCPRLAEKSIVTSTTSARSGYFATTR